MPIRKLMEVVFGRQKIIKKEDMEVRTGATEVVCDDEVGEKGVFAITDEPLLTGGGKNWNGEKTLTRE